MSYLDKIALIGRVTQNNEDPDMLSDSSITPKKGQLGYVDRSFITDGEEGFRIAKVRIREEILQLVINFVQDVVKKERSVYWFQRKICLLQKMVFDLT